MKDTYQYPQSLRNYQSQSPLSGRKNQDSVTSLKQQKQNIGQVDKQHVMGSTGKHVSFLTKRSNRPNVVHEEYHNIDEHNVLTNPVKRCLKQQSKQPYHREYHHQQEQIEKKKAKGKCKGKDKTQTQTTNRTTTNKTNNNNKTSNKKLSSSSARKNETNSCNKNHLNVALRNQLNQASLSLKSKSSADYNSYDRNIYTQQQQVGTQNHIHCKSLQKLQFISNDRSNEIRELMQQRGQLLAENEQLKLKLSNPTFKQKQYIQMIAQRDEQIQLLKKNSQKMQQQLRYLQGQHKKDLAELKRRHQAEIQRVLRRQTTDTDQVRQKVTRVENSNSPPKSYQTHHRQPSQHQNNFETVSYPSPSVATNSSSLPISYSSNNKSLYNNPISSSNYKPTESTSSARVVISPPATTSSTYQSTTASTNAQLPISFSSSSSTKPSSYQNAAGYKDGQLSSSTLPISNVYSQQSKEKDYKVYVGQDGFERRMYTSSSGQTKEKDEGVKTLGSGLGSYQSSSSYSGQPQTHIQSDKLSTIYERSPTSQSQSIYNSNTNQQSKFTNDTISKNLQSASGVESGTKNHYNPFSATTIASSTSNSNLNLNPNSSSTATISAHSGLMTNVFRNVDNHQQQQQQHQYQRQQQLQPFYPSAKNDFYKNSLTFQCFDDN